jgi:hypothetical protein
MHLSIKEIAATLGLTERWVRKQSNSQNWKYKEVKGDSGYVRHFDITQLPVEIRKKLLLEFGSDRLGKLSASSAQSGTMYGKYLTTKMTANIDAVEKTKSKT